MSLKIKHRMPGKSFLKTQLGLSKKWVILRLSRVQSHFTWLGCPQQHNTHRIISIIAALLEVAKGSKVSTASVVLQKASCGKGIVYPNNDQKKLVSSLVKTNPAT